MNNQEFLKSLMVSNYQTDKLVSLEPEDFEKEIERMCGVRDHKMEGLDSEENQRDQTIQFQWGHNHDFGTFKKAGMMHDRHIGLLAHFLNIKAIERDLSDKKIMDIGTWTGGPTLLYEAMGAEVYAVEEVQKYADCVHYLSESFGKRIDVYSESLYGLPSEGWEVLKNNFDIVSLLGVLYHVSDPLVALKICFDMLEVGGKILVETQGINADGAVCQYWGPKKVLSGSKENMNRTGWNWFVPSGKALQAMMQDVGFTVQDLGWAGPGRIACVGVKTHHFEMCQSGLNL